MTLVSALSAIDNVPPGRLKLIADDPIGIGSLTGLQELEPGWLLCNGTVLVNTGRYATLYGKLGTKFGSAGQLPNFMDGVVPIPKGASTFTVVGASGGERLHTLSISEFPNHIHRYKDADPNNNNFNQLNLDGYDPYTNNDVGRTSGNAGGGGAHNNMPPFVVVGFMLVKL